MRVNGEMYLLINGWMNYLCLWGTASLLGARFQRGRAVLASLLGAVYALAAWAGPAYLRGVFAALALDGLMALLALGRRCIPGMLLLFPVGFLFSGLSGYLSQAGTNPWIILLVSGAVAGLLRLLIKNARVNRSGPYRLNICMSGKSVFIPAMRDSGNLLHDAVTGLPVIVADKACAERLLRRPMDLHDLSALPPGFRLIPVRTAAGQKTLMCVSPDSMEVWSGGRGRQVDAVLAFTELPMGKALLPEGLFENAIGEGYHAGA